MLEQIKKFLQKRISGKPLLLGISGGVDSSCLLHLLLEVQKQVHFELHLAHIDHGWREESSIEASILEKKANQKGLSFHLHRITDLPDANLEDYGREQRLRFFKSLFDRYDFQALLLAHHADDQAETILKRIFEGANPRHFGGIREETTLLGMPIWRPLLQVRKAEIRSYLSENEHSYFEDPTNHNEKFLRGRMRTKIFPFLEKEFGKQIFRNLQIFGAYSEEFSAYLNRKAEKFIPITGPLGAYIDFNPFYPLEKLEIIHFLSLLSAKEEKSLSREQIQTLTEIICERRSNKSIEMGSKIFSFDKGYLFLLHKHAAPTWEWELAKSLPKPTHSDWKSVWKGEGTLQIPEGNFTLSKPDMNVRCPNQKILSKWYNDNKVPRVIRTLCPVVYQDKDICAEFLTGKSFIFDPKIPTRTLTLKTRI